MLHSSVPGLLCASQHPETTFLHHNTIYKSETRPLLREVERGHRLFKGSVEKRKLETTAAIRRGIIIFTNTLILLKLFLIY